MPPHPPPIPNDRHSAPDPLGATFVSTSPSTSGKVLKWILISPLIVIVLLILAAVIYSIAPRGISDRIEFALNKKLPGCGSVLVFNELNQQYGNVVGTITSIVPSSLFGLRRARQIEASKDGMSRLCEAEYSSPAGNGTVRYTLTWYDVNNPSLDALAVKAQAASLPELLGEIGKNSDFSEIANEVKQFLGLQK